MSTPTVSTPIDILLVEDNPADVMLTQEALIECKVHNTMNVVEDGEQALAYLRREGRYADKKRPDLILLDLNLPRIDGHEVLAEIKADESLRSIPVVILTTSAAAHDVSRAYSHHANCYITKPVDLSQFIEVVKTIDVFWFGIVKLPNVD